MAEYIVFGLGLFGRSLASEVQDLGHEVVGVDINRELVQLMADELRQAVEADATSEDVLRDLGVANFDAAIVAIGNNEASILTTLLLKRLGCARVIVKASSHLHGEILSRVGADRVIYPEEDTATRLAHGITVAEVVDYLSISNDMGIARMRVPVHLVGVTHSQAGLETRYRVRIIAVVRRDRVVFGSSVGETFESGDEVILAGRDQDLQAFSRSA
ncbi:MAG: TrkA family potassium uptake protein [Dehalococcoidia bacterium]